MHSRLRPVCMIVYVCTHTYVCVYKQTNKQTNIYIYFMHMFDLEQILAARGCLLCVQTCVRLLKRILTSRDTETAHTGSPALLHGQPACYETALN